jgi:hypothetical protein
MSKSCADLAFELRNGDDDSGASTAGASQGQNGLLTTTWLPAHVLDPTGLPPVGRDGNDRFVVAATVLADVPPYVLKPSEVRSDAAQ